MTSRQQYKLIVKKGPNPGHSYPIFAERITIGRDPMSDIIFKDPEVSRRHVQFARVRDSYQVEDLGSTNGTFVNGERLAGEPTLLKSGQEIALGGAVTLIFEEEGSAADVEVLGTVNTNLPAEDDEPHPETAEEPDSFAEFIYDDPDTPDFDEEVISDEKPYIDQLQSVPALTASTPSRKSPSGPSPALAQTSSENMRAMSNQQIMYLVIGTALGTLVCCGSLLLFMYFFGGDWLLNQF